MEDAIEIQAGQLLSQRRLKLVTAESCTGGLIGHLITNIPGSSEYYLGGFVSYANEAKMTLLEIPAGMLGMYGAVSRETVIEMARGARKGLAEAFPMDQLVGLSVSGVAGPGGGTAEKPVGLTWIGLSAPGFERAWQFVWDGDRLANKQKSAQEALRLLVEFLQDRPREG
jgi:PncC family amidohydrolase